MGKLLTYSTKTKSGNIDPIIITFEIIENVPFVMSPKLISPFMAMIIQKSWKQGTICVSIWKTWLNLGFH